MLLLRVPPSYSRTCLFWATLRNLQTGVPIASKLQQAPGSLSAYNVKEIEVKWRSVPVPRTKSVPGIETCGKPDEQGKFYALTMFPYPSGNLHMGHVRVFTLSDLLSRYHRMCGRSVLHPMGWDAFGLPAENAAKERGIHPNTWTESNIAHMKEQMSLIGLDFDWDREFATCRPDYYKHTQWLFLQLYKHELAYRKKALVNWDPVDQTVLANEQVDSEGRSWRSGALIEKKELEQWFFKITDFAEELLLGLDHLDWPKEVKQMQRNWIGKSIGMEFHFKIVSSQDEETIAVYTSRPETLNGVTFLAIAPNHSLLDSPLVQNKEQVRAAAAQFMREQQFSHRTDIKSGVDTGILAEHPLTGQQLPVFVTNYVLCGYAKGAVMGVPAHDERDAAFAKAYNLASVQVVDQEAGTLTEENGDMSGMSIKQAVNELERRGIGKSRVQYKLLDWLISRQRYWGCPIPMVHCSKCGVVPVSEEDLPILLPKDMIDPSTRRPCECPRCKRPAFRDPDTMDTFVDSSWYFLRYLDPHNTKLPCSPKVGSLLPIDLYVGGVEHAILHLLYARFFTKFINKYVMPIGQHAGKPRSPEPFQKLMAQGMVHGLTLRDPDTGRYLRPKEITWKSPSEPTFENGKHPRVSYEKMSKSKYNGVVPEQVIQKYGSDATRAYIIGKAPAPQILEWDDSAITGMIRWLNRVHGVVMRYMLLPNAPKVEDSTAPQTMHERQLWATMNELVNQTTNALNDADGLNNVPSNLIKMTHAIHDFITEQALTTRNCVIDASIEMLLRCMAPVAPCLAQELFGVFTGQPGSDVWKKWPRSASVQVERVVVVIQVNGKTRGNFVLDQSCLSDASQLALDTPVGQKWIGKKTIRKTIIANNGKLINFLV